MICVPRQFSDGNSQIVAERPFADGRRQLKWTIRPINIINADTFSLSAFISLFRRSKCHANVEQLSLVVTRNWKLETYCSCITILSWVFCLSVCVCAFGARRRQLLFCLPPNEMQFDLCVCGASRFFVFRSNNCFCLRANVFRRSYYYLRCAAFSCHRERQKQFEKQLHLNYLECAVNVRYVRFRSLSKYNKRRQNYVKFDEFGRLFAWKTVSSI